MWVTFFVQRATDSLVFTKYALPGDPPVDLPVDVTTGELISIVLEKASMSLDELLEKESVKINLQVSLFNRLVTSKLEMPAASEPTSHADLSVVLQAIQAQQKQVVQQNEMIQTLLSALSLRDSRPTELVKPEPFDSTSGNPEAWISFFEYACKQNGWDTDEQRVKHMLPFLSGIARKWYELRIIGHECDAWSTWKESFISSFRGSPLERWDQAIFYRYRSGPVIEYFFEKRRLLLLAEPDLPLTSVITLVIHGLPRELQRQVQARAPKTLETLRQSLQDMACHWTERTEKSHRDVQGTGPSGNREFRAQPPKSSQAASHRESLHTTEMESMTEGRISQILEKN